MSRADARPATGFVVAGGGSRRMGRDKALLAWGAGTLLDHAIMLLREACDDVRILAGPERRYADRGLPVLVDSLREAGSLGGVYSGLQALERPLGLFLAVDLPLVPAALLRQLLEWAEDYDAVVPVSADGPEPLCAAYGGSCLDPIRRCLERGEFKMTAFWPEVRVREVGVAALRRFGDPAQLFLNVNEPADYERARR